MARQTAADVAFEKAVDESRHAAQAGAGRLYSLSTSLLFILGFFAVLGVLGFAAAGATGTLDWSVAAGWIAATVVLWLFSLLPYVAARAIARYIDYRLIADLDRPVPPESTPVLSAPSPSPPSARPSASRRSPLGSRGSST